MNTADLTEIEFSMSNFDHEIDDGMAEALKAGGVFGRHHAWNFNGMVWFANEKFHEEVWVHNSPVTTVSADTLEELMQEVNSEFGSD